MTVPVPGPLDAIELVLAAAAATSPDELATARLAALRSHRLIEPVPGAPDPDDPHPAGVHLLGGLAHQPGIPLTVSARIGRITRHHGRHAQLDDDTPAEE
jgi:hypothetical protein